MNMKGAKRPKRENSQDAFSDRTAFLKKTIILLCHIYKF